MVQNLETWVFFPVELLALSELAAFKCALLQVCHFQELKFDNSTLTKTPLLSPEV